MNSLRASGSRRFVRTLSVASFLCAVAGFWATQSLADRIYRVGILTPSEHELRNIRNHTVPELGRLGFVEGKNLFLETRLGTLGELDVMARDLVALRPDAIITVGPPAAHAARRATGSIPIVMGFMGQDPVAAGLAQSLSRPGGNVTGTLILGQKLEGKRLQLLHQTVPGRNRIGVLLQPGNKLVEAAKEAKTLGLDLVVFRARGPANYAAAFAGMRSAGVQAVLIAPSPAFFRDAKTLAGLALEYGLPTMCQWPEMAHTGCLLGYGPNYQQLRRQTAGYLVRIFKGDSPADLPIEWPSRFEFAVNLKTAKTLGLSVPPSVLLRANTVIE